MRNHIVYDKYQCIGWLKLHWGKYPTTYSLSEYHMQRTWKMPIKDFTNYKFYIIPFIRLMIKSLQLLEGVWCQPCKYRLQD